MDFRQLEIFRAVIENRSATRAAVALGVTQPAVSAQIARLETQVGFALFDRKGGRLEPTPEAMLLYDEVTQSLSGIDRLTQAILDIRQAQAGRLVVASQPGAAISLLPKLAAEFLRGRPGVTIRFVTRSSQTIKMIPPEAFDLGLAEPPLDATSLDVQRFRVRCVAVLPEDHPCASRRKLTPRALDGQPFIAMFREHMTFHSVGRAFDEAGARWNVCAEAEFFATACALAANGAGVCIVDPFAAADAVARGKVVSRPFEPAIPYELVLFRASNRPQSRLAAEFAAALEAELTPFLYR